MDLDTAIYNRRAVRQFLDKPVPSWMVMEVIKAATWAPSAANQQPWAFVVIRGKDLLAAYSDQAKAHLLEIIPPLFGFHLRIDALSHPSTNLFHSAGTLIVIYSKPSEYEPSEDCCLAAENLMLASYGLGLGSCPIGFTRPWFDLPKIKQELEVPGDHHAVMPIVIGWPQAVPIHGRRSEPEILAWRGDSD